MKEIKLAFGLRKGKIVHIDEISKNERGLSCNCICPSCGAHLQAKLGAKNRHHFSHHSPNCSNEIATQTALHILAKEIIAQNGTMLFPSIRHEYINSSHFSHKYIQDLPEYFVIKPERHIKCNKVLLERKLSSIVPDVIFVSGENICIIEIAVTHFVDKIKEEKIKSLGFPAIEIDLSDYYRQNLNREEIEKQIINKSENRRWIYYPNLAHLISQEDMKYKEAIEKIEYEKREAEKERIRQEEQLRIKREAYYKNKLKQYRSDIKTNDVIKEFNFRKEMKDGSIPFFLDIPIDGEIVFKCDRRIWQSALFDKFIYYRNVSKNPIVSINSINNWVKDYQDLFGIDWYAINKDFGKTYYVIEQYLTYIHFLGFISELYRQKANLLHSHTLIPPEQENASLLYSAVSSIDSYIQNPNRKIEEYLIDAYGVFLSKKKESDYHIIHNSLYF